MRLVRSLVRNSILVLAASAGLSEVHADVVFDSITPAAGSVGSRSYNTSAAFEYMGDPYSLAPGTATLTGIDLLGVNFSGVNLASIRVNVFLWGAVNLGAVTPVNPAFSNLLGSTAVIVTGATSAVLDFERTAGVTPFITFNSPMNVPNGVVGVTINLQGSTDGASYGPVPGLTPLVAVNVPASVGSSLLNGFYINKDSTGTGTGTDTNGNFTTAVTAFASGTGNNAADQAMSIRLYGTINNTGPHSWASPADGDWTAGARWSPAGVPTVTSDATFNLASSGYTVNVSAGQTAANVLVRGDQVTLKFNSDASTLSVKQSLSVGIGGGTNSTVAGGLNLIRGTGTQYARLIAGSITDGDGGDVGTISVGNLIYLFSNGPVNVGIGSSIAIAAGGKLGAASFNLSGSNNAWSSLVDIGRSSLDLRSGDYASTVNQIRQGLNAGGLPWRGLGGITSSAAASDTTRTTAVGVVANSDPAGRKLFGTGGVVATTFDGDNPAATAVLARWTYYGDANLDGKVDGSDYALIDNGLLATQSGWYNGDFNYDGVVDAADYSLIDNSFNRQTGLASVPTSLAAAAVQVPEPMGYSSLMGLATFFRRRSRSGAGSRYVRR